MSEESHELALYAENNGDLFYQRTQPIIKSLALKKVRGIYDPQKALILWKYVADDAAQRYTKEFDTPGRAGSYGIFTPEIRRETAKELAKYYANHVDIFFRDHPVLLPKKYRHKNPSRHSVHTKKWDRCVRDVKTKHEAADPYAVCTASLGYRGSVKAGHRRRNPVTKGYTSDSVYGPDNIYWKKGVLYFIGIPDDKTKPELFFTSDGWRKNYVLDPKYKNNLFWMPEGVGNAQFGFHATSAGQSLPSGYHMEAARSTLRTLRTLSYPRHVTRSEARKKNPVNGFLLSVKNTATGQRAYYTGEEPEAFDSNKMRGKIYATAAHARAAAGMLQRDKHLKPGWRYAVVIASNVNPAVAPAEKLYTDFHGEPPRRIKRRVLPQFTEGLEIGPVAAITYDTVRDGEKIRFEHEFKKRAAPLLITNGRTLALTGGRYRFTDRGIVDRET